LILLRRIFAGLLALAAVLACDLAPGRAQAQSTQSARIALLIGNGSYSSVTPLANPPSDARLMAKTLEQAGFKVTVLIDADQATMKRGIADFGRALRAAGPQTVALFYYAGHAVQSFGNNYLLPVDSQIQDQADLDLVGVEAGWVLRQLFSARVRTNIVILDACRNNPFKGIKGFDDEGLAEMNAPTGSFLAYSTAPGNVALDGTTGNSPYTRALADQIGAGPQSIELLFKNVRRRVLADTNGAQTPWESSSLIEDFEFTSNRGLQLLNAPDETLWNDVRNSGDPARIQLYLDTFPAGAHRADAELAISALTAGKGGVTAGGTNGVTVVPQGSMMVTFSGPIQSGEPQIVGKSIEQLIAGQPMFPPFEGIPDELWKGQHCTNCHQWNRERLCEQAGFYLGGDAARSLEKPHPLGLSFKQTLKAWAAAGCP
jgi:hypothetical protein